MTRPKPVSIRVPLEVKEWLVARAIANNRSVNGEIVAVLKAAKQSETAKGAA